MKNGMLVFTSDDRQITSIFSLIPCKTSPQSTAWLDNSCVTFMNIVATVHQLVQYIHMHIYMMMMMFIS